MEYMQKYFKVFSLYYYDISKVTKFDFQKDWL